MESKANPETCEETELRESLSVRVPKKARDIQKHLQGTWHRSQHRVVRTPRLALSSLPSVRAVMAKGYLFTSGHA